MMYEMTTTWYKKYYAEEDADHSKADRYNSTANSNSTTDIP